MQHADEEQVSESIIENQSKIRNMPTFIEINDQTKIDCSTNENKNTERKTKSAVRQFQTWLHQDPRNETSDITKMQPGELDNFLRSFLRSIRKADGSD